MDDVKDSVSSAAMGDGGGASAQGAGHAHQIGQQGVHYSIPGILHFLQHEWARFEMDRAQWEVEKAELQARISFLQGERKGQENLKNDLVRRIKMLEYALKQERAKYSKLKYGADAAAGAVELKPPTDEDGLELPPIEGGDNYIAVSNANWRQGRQLLRQYLREIGYTDTIIDVRSNRVRSLLGLTNNDELTTEENNQANLAMNGETNNANNNRKQQQRNTTNALAEEIMMDTEAAVMANFDFLSSEVEVDDDDDEDGTSGGAVDDGYNPSDLKLKAAKLAQSVAADNAETDKETEEVLNEFNFLTGDSVDSVKSAGSNTEEAKGLGGHPGGMADFLSLSSPSSRSAQSSNNVDNKEITNNLELGELEQLTITNENESSYDITAPKESFRKTWSAKYTLRSHFDGVRALAFHPTEPVLITASEDQTLKLWNLQKTIPAKKSASLDVEPVYTFRAHRGAVLSLCVSPQGNLIFSGGLDSSIRIWNMPPSNVDPYDSYDPSVLNGTLTGHSDAIWSLSYNGTRQQLLSASADGTVKLWNVNAKTLVKTFGGGGDPTSVDWVHDENGRMVASYSNADCIIYDLETGKQVIKMDTSPADSSSPPMGLITKVISHPTLPLTITAHDDRHIRFFDNNTGKLTHAMVAHLDAVTAMDIDANGMYLISGSHDCSVRLWNLETKTCVQEITAHRKKFDESIFGVAFHPAKPYIASAGADALAKVFV